MKIYTVWAALKEDPGAFWMISAHDEYTWEGDPDRCEAEIRVAKERATDCDYRDIWLDVDSQRVEEAFQPVEVEAGVEVQP